MMPWDTPEGSGVHRVGPRGAVPGWAALALPLRAFFCSFSVSDDFFLISCRARLYSAGDERRAVLGPRRVGAGTRPGPSPSLTFRVVLVQLVHRLLPVLDALLQRVDEALQQGAANTGCRSGPAGVSPAAPPPARGAHSLGELPQLGLDAAVAHAHARERRADVPGGPWRGKRVAWERAHRDRCTPGLGHEGARWPREGQAASGPSCPQHPTVLPVLFPVRGGMIIPQ